MCGACEATHASPWQQSLRSFSSGSLIRMDQIVILQLESGESHHGGTGCKGEVPTLRGARRSVAVGDHGAVYKSGASPAVRRADGGDSCGGRNGGSWAKGSELREGSARVEPDAADVAAEPEGISASSPGRQVLAALCRGVKIAGRHANQTTVFENQNPHPCPCRERRDKRGAPALSLPLHRHFRRILTPGPDRAWHSRPSGSPRYWRRSRGCRACRISRPCRSNSCGWRS